MDFKISRRGKFRINSKDIFLKPWTESFVDRDAAPEESFRGIIGQDRAIAALTLGINVEAPGYNIYVCGESGTGRTSTVLDMLHRTKRCPRSLVDRCFVMNFKDPDRPRLLEFPAGAGVKFRADIDELITRLHKQVPKVFEATDYSRKKEKLSVQYERSQRTKVQKFEAELKKGGFALAQVRDAPAGGRPEIMPLVRGKVLSMGDVSALVDKGKYKQEKFKKIQEEYETWRSKLMNLMKELRKEGRELEEKSKKLDREIFSEIIGEMVAEIIEKYSGRGTDDSTGKQDVLRITGQSRQKLMDYLQELKEDLIENLDIFKEPDLPPQEDAGAEKRERHEDMFADYRVNVILDNTGREECPVVQETFPTFNNLFGAIERPFEDPIHTGAHFTSIKAGSILKADGGFLVVNALDVFTEPGVWKTLKRTLKHRQLEIQNLDVPGYSPPSALKPEPINVDVKVVMIGDEYLYRMLYFLEGDFKKIFKVKSEFDTEMPLDSGNVSKYLSFVDRICGEEKLPKFDRDAVVAMVEMGIRNTEDRRKLSTRFSDVADLMREASYFTNLGGKKEVTRQDVEQAVTERRRRVGMDEDHLQEMFDRNQIFVSTSGGAVGMVNALTVFDQGDHQFGRPVRVTASVATGKGGVINIERRAGLSGSLYDKGVMILTGFLMERFGRRTPLNLRASITLEQSYGGVDGDSASSADVYALVSAIAELSLDQSLAVTGSVNQKGEIQPVGGICFKIEGFYDVCAAKGLTGKQGVVIPRSNVDHLTLRPDVEKAIEEGNFHLYSVSTIDEGIELLTGIPAGVADPAGYYPEGTVNHISMQKLAEMNAALKAKDAAE